MRFGPLILYKHFRCSVAQRKDFSRRLTLADYDEQAELTLGERLLVGVRNLWKEVNRHDKVLDHHGEDIEDIKRRLGPVIN
jgi:hypothetical protein